jgi:O-antigen ligase
VDIIGPQWFYAAVLNIMSLTYCYYLKFWEYNTSFKTTLLAPTGLPYLAYCIFAVVSAFYAINGIESIVSLARLFITLTAYIFFLLFIQRTNSFFPIIAQAVTIILFYHCISELKDFFYLLPSKGLNGAILSMKSEMGNKNTFAASIIIKIPFAIYCIFYGKYFPKTINMAVLTTALLTLFLANARSSYIGLFIELVIFLVFITTNLLQHKKIKKAIVETCYLLIPLLISLLISQFVLKEALQNYPGKSGYFGTVTERLKSIDISTELGTGFRKHLFQNSINIIHDYPITGVGYGNWKLASIPYEKFANIDVVVNFHAHNDFLETTCEVGVPGGICYFLLFAVVFVTGFYQLITRKNKNPILTFSLMALGGYFIDACFNYPMERTTMQLYFACWLAIFSGAVMPAAHNRPTFFQPAFKWAIAAVILLNFGCCYVCWKTFQSFIIQKKAYAYAYLYPGKGKLSWREINHEFPSIPNITQTTLPINTLKAEFLVSDKRYEEALYLLNSSPNANPYIGYTEYLKGIICYERGKIDSAVVFAQKAFILRPLNYSHYQLLVNAAVKKKDTELLKNTFNIYKSGRNHAAAWKIYLDALNELKTDSATITDAVKEAFRLFPRNETIQKMHARIQ